MPAGFSKEWWANRIASEKKLIPKGEQKCEICKVSKLFYLFDARIVRCQYGARGHWMWLCLSCVLEWGLGYGSDEIRVFQRSIARYIEVRNWRKKIDSNTLKLIEQSERKRNDNKNSNQL